MVVVMDGLEIPDSELVFSTSRSSGPGGQNVNKVSTRVALRFDVNGSPSLTERQRQLLRQNLAGRISKSGILRVVAQRERTQLANREDALRRFAGLMRDGLAEAPERVPLDPPARVEERRLEEKRRRGRLKRERAVDLSGEG